MNEPFFLVSCSPRRGGNSDFAVRELQKALPAPCRVCRLTESGVRPCVSCAFCDAHPGKCSLDGAGDGAAAMFQTMFRSRLSILVSPILSSWLQSLNIPEAFFTLFSVKFLTSTSFSIVHP